MKRFLIATLFLLPLAQAENFREKEKRIKEEQNERWEKMKAYNDIKIKKKMNKIRYNSEKELLEKLFSGEIPQKGASPVAKENKSSLTKITMETSSDKKDSPKENQLLVGVGSSYFSGDKLNFESGLAFNGGIFNKAHKNLFIGFFAGISNMSFTIGGRLIPSFATDVDYQKINFDILGKYYLTTGGKYFNPYLQGGIGYNKFYIRYKNRYKGDGVGEKFFSAIAGLGTEVSFTNKVGLNFSAVLRANINKRKPNSNDSILHLVSDRFKNSKEVALSAGAVVLF